MLSGKHPHDVHEERRHHLIECFWRYIGRKRCGCNVAVSPIDILGPLSARSFVFALNRGVNVHCIRNRIAALSKLQEVSRLLLEKNNALQGKLDNASPDYFHLGIQWHNSEEGTLLPQGIFHDVKERLPF